MLQCKVERDEIIPHPRAAEDPNGYITLVSDMMGDGDINLQTAVSMFACLETDS